jgi:hypothetical protein
MQGFDAACDVSAIAEKIKSAGLDFACRYYSHNPGKNLSPAEAAKLQASGIRLVSVWEAAGNLPGSFSADQGTRDAAEALRQAEAVGQPPGTTIYFAVDFDALASQISNLIVPYFASVNTVLAGKYQVGVYGSGLVCTTLRTANLARNFWLACAPGWQGTRNFTGWHIRQSLPADPWGFGFDVDPDEAVAGDFGAWPVTET